MLRALRNDETCQLILCDVLEMELVDNIDMQQQIITTLQTTKNGKQQYEILCQKQLHLKELVSGKLSIDKPNLIEMIEIATERGTTKVDIALSINRC